MAYKNGGTTLVGYKYDGQGRRVAETASGTTTDLYYSDQWQVLEEAVSGTTKARYVWSPVYVDAMILRDRDADGSGGNGLEERLWAVQDANFNVVALVNGSGTVVERYAYDSFGAVTVLNGSWTVIGSTAYGWVYLHQGTRRDATSGLDDHRGRWYSPTLGRWATMDPIRYTAGDVNLYRAVGNNTVIRVDPSGLQAVPQTQPGGGLFGPPTIITPSPISPIFPTNPGHLLPPTPPVFNPLPVQGALGTLLGGLPVLPPPPVFSYPPSGTVGFGYSGPPTVNPIGPSYGPPNPWQNPGYSYSDPSQNKNILKLSKMKATEVVELGFIIITDDKDQKREYYLEFKIGDDKKDKDKQRTE